MAFDNPELQPKQNKYELKDSVDYPRSYYSFIDKIELLRDDSLEIHLDSVRIEDFDRSPENDDFLLESALYNIIVEITQTDAVRMFGPIDSIQCAWFKIELTHLKTVTPAFLFEDNTNLNLGDSLYQTFIKTVDFFAKNDPKLTQLKAIFSMDKLSDASESDIQNALDYHLNAEQIINVYNVGQGNLTAICAYKNVPFVYIDVGGGSYRNAHTYRFILNLCYTKYKVVILTHWDADHIWTAHKNINKFVDKTWIVPRQPLNTLQKNLLKKLQNNGNDVLVFPSTNDRIDTGICTIVRCSGPANDKNESGIAIYAESFYDDKRRMKVLLPGDVSYKHITRLNDTDLRIGGLLVTHHGAEFDDINVLPPAQAPNRIIYSFGLGNTYAHARAESVKAHYRISWTNELTTLNGHVTFTSCIYDFDMPCGSSCNLNLRRGFEIP